MFNSSFNFNGTNNYIHTRSLLGEIAQVIGGSGGETGGGNWFYGAKWGDRAKWSIEFYGTNWSDFIF